MPDRKPGFTPLSARSEKPLRPKEVVKVSSQPESGDLPVELPESAEKIYDVEIVYMALYDVGVDIDLEMAAEILPCRTETATLKKRDAPDSFTLPKPLIVEIGSTPGPIDTASCADPVPRAGLSAIAKLFDEGVICVELRRRVSTTLRGLHGMERSSFETCGVRTTVTRFVETKARSIAEHIVEAIGREGYESDILHESEHYVAYRFFGIESDPETFFELNRSMIATLLTGEPPGAPLHVRQLWRTLNNPFSYLTNDFALFDMDRCLIIDPSNDYEDLLLIIEHANYQLLELRALDRLLDRWLEESERDLRMLYIGSHRRKRTNALQRKFADMQALRIEALFILENLENSSKIIGDYFFGQIYEHLCSIFNTAGWKWSIERRLDVLQDIFEIVRGDISEQRTMVLEIIFIIVCIVFPIIQIVQVMLTTR
ncbi:MAG: hypothetical protein NT080_01835 [Spirochaetes bacterium]|nr:hypothetical protein [Spirochaetota bacterium]